MTYDEAIEFLYGLRWFGAKFGLENPRRLAALAGHPERRLRFLHVAGTNGKGSVCAFMESIYREAGYRVGLYTSPHLVRFGERIQVNRQLIPDAEVARLVQEMQPWLKTFPADHHPTFFEVVTVMALRYFEEQRCDVVIWETGMGGRLDATNIVTSLAAVITNIHYDHQQWLGYTLAEIAREKAGILKPGVPCVTATESPEALDVIRTTALRLGCPLYVLGPEAAETAPLDRIKLPLPGAHQRMNAALALAAVRTVSSTLPVSEEAIERGLTRATWSGRFQRVRLPTGPELILDGAHNVGAMEVLGATLETEYPGVRPAFVLGVMADKDLEGIAARVASRASRVVCVPVPSERSADPVRLAAACRSAAPQLPVEVCGSLAEALDRVREESVAVVTGSLYLVGEALERLEGQPGGVRDEKGLNSWTGVVEPAPAVQG